MRVIRNGQVREDEKFPDIEGELIYHFPPTGISKLPVDPIDLMQKHAIRVYCRNGYPILFTMRAGDFPKPLGIPYDEIVHVESWDQS